MESVLVSEHDLVKEQVVNFERIVKDLRQELILFCLFVAMIVFVLALKHLAILKKTQLPKKRYEDYELN